MKSKTVSILMAAILAAFSAVRAADQSAAEWAAKEKASLDAITKASLVEIAKGAPDSYRALFAAVKPDYKSDPVELTRIAALTQIITTSARPETRSAYADALLEAAAKAEAADVACFFLDQLRWCATKAQSAGIRELTRSEKQGVAALAAIAALAAEGHFGSQQKDAVSNPYAEYSAQIAKLGGSQKSKALLGGFDNADARIAGIALREAAQIDIQDQINALDARQAESAHKKRHAAGASETKLWCARLASTDDPARLTMLIDMLGARGSPEALNALAEYVGHADTAVADAAARAMIAINPEAYVKALPEVLKNLPASHADVMKKAMARLPTDLAEKGLIRDYDAYSMTGKELVIALLGARRSEKGIEMALAAINSTAAESAKSGYRLLRDCAGPKEAEILIGKLLKERHSRAGMVQDAVAGAARRDTTGTYVKMLEDAWPKAKGDSKLSLLGTFGRIGNSKLLPLVEESLKDKDPEVSTEAVRALCAWNGLDAVKALMTLACTAPDTKHRVLAQRAVEKQLGAKEVNKAEWKKQWETISAGAVDAEIKNKLDAFFAKAP
jgi:hypothetical protein